MFLTIFVCPFSRSAHPYGTPSVLSSYSNFYNTDAGAPNGGTAYSFSLFPSPYINSLGVFFQEREPAGIPSMLSDGEHTGRNNNKCARWVTVLLYMHRFCQHRWPAIAGMVGFRDNVGDAPLTGWVASSSQQIAFARGMTLSPFSSSFRRLAHI